MADIRIGQGFDVHALAEGIPMHLGGILIPCSRGFVAHSDGDVALHALCDAILGALALGDIGKFFPDNDDAYKGADSTVLLGKVCQMASDRGWRAGNVDITIALEAPKLLPYIDEMRSVISKVLACDVERVSIKASTTEKLGFTGRGEGCAVWAVCILVKD